MDTSSINPVAAGSTTAATPSERPQGAARKTDRLEREAPVEREAATRGESKDALTTRPAPASFAASSVLTTYRDVESGRLIVRVSDSERGFVMVEFPPANSLHYLQTLQAAPAEPASTTRIKV